MLFQVMNNLEEPTGNENLVSNTRKEQSYEISPFKESDDEDDDDNDVPNSKFIPYWARYVLQFCYPSLVMVLNL